MKWKVGAAVVAAVVVAAVITRSQFLDTVTVSSNSMSPTVCTGDTLLLARLHGPRSVRNGEIVTFPDPQNGEQVIKRVVATAGQSVVIKDSELIVDGRTVPEPYVDHSSIDGVYTASVKVPAGTVFVLGDNREVSIDSRAFGPIPTSSIDGRLLVDLWSNCPAPSGR
jgi:signal peptidase I